MHVVQFEIISYKSVLQAELFGISSLSPPMRNERSADDLTPA